MAGAGTVIFEASLFLSTQAVFRQWQHCHGLKTKPEGCDSDVCPTFPIYQLDTGLCSEYFLCICQEIRLCPWLQHEFTEAVQGACCWHTRMHNSYSFSIFRFLSIPGQLSKHQQLLLWSRMSLCSERTTCPPPCFGVRWPQLCMATAGHVLSRWAQLCSPRWDSPPGWADLQLWQVNEGISVCLPAFWCTQRGGKSAWSR